MIRGIEALRALAVWMVVIHHLRGSFGQIWPPLAQTHVFAAGVDLFFVISGVVMVVSTADGAINARQFWIKRAARILPLYWLVTGCLLLLLMLGLRPLGISDWSVQDTVASMLLLPDIRSDGYPAPLLAVGWTLIFEAFFYGIFGLALALRTGRMAGVGAIFVMLSLALIGWITKPSAHVAQVFLSPLLVEFAAGMCLGLMATRLARLPVVIPLLSIACAGLWVGIKQTHLPDSDLITAGYDGSLSRLVVFGVPAVLIVAAALGLEGRRWALPPLIAGQAAASYAIYLIHMLAIQIGEKLVGHGVLLIAIIPVIAVAGLVVHRYVERPMTGIARRLLTGQQRPKSSSRRMMSSSSR